MTFGTVYLVTHIFGQAAAFLCYGSFSFLGLCVSVQLICQPRDKYLRNEVELSFNYGSAILHFGLRPVRKLGVPCNCYRSLGVSAVTQSLYDLCMNLKLLFSKADQFLLHKKNRFHDSIKLGCAVF